MGSWRSQFVRKPTRRIRKAYMKTNNANRLLGKAIDIIDSKPAKVLDFLVDLSECVMGISDQIFFDTFETYINISRI